MTGDEHWHQAEALLKHAEGMANGGEDEMVRPGSLALTLQSAQVHATLALASAVRQAGRSNITARPR